MPEDRNKNQDDMGKGQQGDGGQQAPGRNPRDDKSAGQTGGQDPDRKGGQFESDVERNRQDKGYKEGGQNEETRR